ncbi:MAG: hypothetical protein KDA97_02540 [Acidimicrobiales bacterium]|nr:hypothetical protein [Acidimicrobiales bacterium]
MHPKVLVPALLLVGSLLASCSSDGSDGSAPTTDAPTTEASEPTEPTTTEVTAPADGILLVAGELEATLVDTSCASADESSVALEAAGEYRDDSLNLSMNVIEGQGTISVESGSQATGVFLDGTVTSLEVGDAGDLTAAGTFDDGEAFTVTGACVPGTAPTTTTTTAPGSTTTTTTTAPPTTTTAAPTTAAPATTVPAGPHGGTIELDSPSFSKSFTVKTCANPSESTLVVTAITRDGFKLTLASRDGKGALNVAGGSGADAVALHGAVTSVSVGDTGEITVEGDLGSGSGPAEAFEVTGSCTEK